MNGISRPWLALLFLVLASARLGAAEHQLDDCVGTWVTEQGGYRITLTIHQDGSAQRISTLVTLGLSDAEQGTASVDHGTLSLRILDEADFTRELGERRYRIVNLTQSLLELIWDGPIVPVKFQRVLDSSG
jgi:hypothetical protein